MKRKWKVKDLLNRKLEDPAYRKMFERDYEIFKLEVQLLLALERKQWTYDDLAKAIGGHKSHISRDLKGRGLGSASLGRVAKMAQALGMRFMPVCIPEHKVKQALPTISRLIQKP